MTSTPATIGNRYIIHDLLGQGGMGAVYCATDRLTGGSVALKRVITPLAHNVDTPSDSDFQLALSNEFRTLASLRHPNIISVLDYGFEDKQPYFTMELLEAPQTILTAGKDTSVDRQIQLLVELLQALVYLHRRGVLHRDLKPGNVLVTQEGNIKVLDFGLSLTGAYSRTNIQENTAGTLAYMAPELFFDEPASVASDLYAVGVIACELLAGHHPYNPKNVGVLMQGVLHAAPDLSGLEGTLREIVARLLEKQPHDRHNSAADVIRELWITAGQPAPVESSAIRESFLQAAKFVGRQDELEQLKAALDATIRSQSGEVSQDRQVSCAWMIGGESGVGKSRLIDELRIRALVRGALVLRGQSITDGSLPYQIWREPLRRLVLSVALQDSDASVLKNLIPGIETLLERVIPDPPALDPQMSRNRFTRVVTDLFRSLNQPTVVILEDLQWATEENLELLKQLIPLTSGLPLLIIASYRDDERPELREMLSDMQFLKLKRLNEAHVSELSESILGAVGQQPQIVDWLYKETEGNVFFLVEIVRELAEQAGELDLINLSNLPAKLLPEGIQSIVQRRLSRIPEHNRSLLQLAALAGRELDLNLLNTFSPDLALWLENCNISGVLEVEQDRWRFSHDKLREHIILTIASDLLPSLHQQLAEALEQVHPDDPIYVPAIAHHYQQAGIHNKAARYLTQAAELAKNAYDNNSAIALALQALTSIEHTVQSGTPSSEWDTARLHLYERLGDLYEVTGKSEEARHWFERGLSWISDSDAVRRTRFCRKWANTWVTQRQPQEAIAIFQNAEATLNSITENRSTQWWTEWIDLQLDLMWANYWLARPQVMAELAEKIRPKLDQFGTPLQRSRFFRSLVLVAIRRQSLVTDLSDQTVTQALTAVAASKESGDLLETSVTQFTLGLVYIMRQEWNKAIEELQHSLKLCEQIGGAEYKLLSLTYLTVCYRHLGQESLVAQFVESSMKAATETKTTIYVAAAKANQAWLAWRRGDLGDSQRLAEEAVELWQRFKTPFPHNWLALWPLIGIAHKLGELPQAFEYIKALYAPGQYAPREPLATPLRSVMDAWDQGDSMLAQFQVDSVIQLARQLNYL